MAGLFVIPGFRFSPRAAPRPQASLRRHLFLGVDPSFESIAEARLNPTGVPKFRLPGIVFSRKRQLPHKVARGMALLFMNEDRWVRIRDRFKARLLKKPVMNPETRHMLAEAYREDIQKLQSLIGRDLSHWLGKD